MAREPGAPVDPDAAPLLRRSPVRRRGGDGCHHRHPGFFADNYLQLIAFAAQLGLLPNPFGDSRNAPPSSADIARVAVVALTDPDRHAGHLPADRTGPARRPRHDRGPRPGARPARAVDGDAGVPFAKAMRAFGYDAFMTAQTRHYLVEHLRLRRPERRCRTGHRRPAETFASSALGYAQRPGAGRTPKLAPPPRRTRPHHRQPRRRGGRRAAAALPPATTVALDSYLDRDAAYTLTSYLA